MIVFVETMIVFVVLTDSGLRLWFEELEIDEDTKSNHSQDVEHQQIPTPTRNLGLDYLDFNWDFLGDEAITIFNPGPLDVLDFGLQRIRLMFEITLEGMSQGIDIGFRPGEAGLKSEGIVNGNDINVSLNRYVNPHSVLMYHQRVLHHRHYVGCRLR